MEFENQHIEINIPQLEQKVATREDLEKLEQRITENLDTQMRQLKDDLIVIFNAFEGQIADKRQRS